jgi:CII-binding regulator of phage lambda lysogenization HflD
VTFLDGTTTLGTGTLSGGVTTYTTSSLAAGQNSLTAVYGGDANNLVSTSAVLTETVQAITTTTLASSVNPSLPGSSVTLTASVTNGGSATSTGMVTFMDGATTLGTGALSGGVATYTTSSLAVGQHSMAAVYGGDANNVGSTSAVLIQTVQATTSTTLASSVNPSKSGSSVAFTATVTAGAATLTGTITFMDGATTLGAGALSGGVATYTTSSLAVGQHSVTAVYGGDTNNAGSTSAVLTQTVSAADFTLTSNPTSATVAAGQPGKFTLTVTPQGSFAGPINFSCSGLPNLAGCSFSPASLTPNTSTVTTTLTITTAGQAASLAPPQLGRHSNPRYAIWLVLPAMLLGTVGLAAPKRRKLLSCCFAFLPVGGCLLQAACGGSAGRGTPTGTYSVTVTGGASTTQHTTILTLTIQ